MKAKRRFAAASMSLILLSIFVSVLQVHAQPQTSDLWGENGELWDPDTSVLKDFSNVGYKSGNVSIPDWPVGVNVLDYGAIPNDAGDDSAAFLQAIEACPPNMAIFVPNGRYVILQQLRIDRDYFVLRGENMYETVLFFPKNLGEIYPAVYYDDSYGYKGGFFHITGNGGTHRSIESLTFEFREQTKMGFFEFRGANAIKYTGGVTDSWIRNIHFRNADFGVEFDGGERVSILNLYFDHYVGRPAFIESSDHRQVSAYLGIGMGKMRYCLIHNVRLSGDMFHDVDIINVPTYNVVSHMYGPNVALDQHGQGAHHNLYTDIHCGIGPGANGLDDERRMHHETHWGISRFNRDWAIHPDGHFRDAMKSNHVFVGYSVDYPDTRTSTFYYENIDPRWLTPINIYLAQMEYRGKELPEAPVIRPPAPPEHTGDVRFLIPSDDITPGFPPDSNGIAFNGYLKFDLRRQKDLDTIFRARLRICTRARTDQNFMAIVKAVEDDSWSQLTLTEDNAPEVGGVLSSAYIDDQERHKWWEFDITDYVKNEWAADKLVSLHVSNDQSGVLVGLFHTRESGNAPLLVIERVPSVVPGPPAAPIGMQTTSENGHILLDWEDNTEADFSHYNVYRTPAPNSGHPVAQGLTMSEYTDISASEDRGLSEMPHDRLYFYTITAVDTHGYESVRSTEFVGNTLHPSNDPPAFGAGPHSLPVAIPATPYSGSIANSASDPESNPLYYFKVSGPAWLKVAYDGTLSGIPEEVDAGTYDVIMQVNALGGRDQAVFSLTVTGDITYVPPTSSPISSPYTVPPNPPVNPPPPPPPPQFSPPGWYYLSMSRKMMKSSMSKKSSKSNKSGGKMAIRMKTYIKHVTQNVFARENEEEPLSRDRGVHRTTPNAVASRANAEPANNQRLRMQ